MGKSCGINDIVIRICGYCSCVTNVPCVSSSGVFSCPDCGRLYDSQNLDKKTPRRKISKNLRARVMYKSDFECCRCGDRDNLTVDHIVPLSRGGSNKLGNLQMLCYNCNQAKGDSVL